MLAARLDNSLAARLPRSLICGPWSVACNDAYLLTMRQSSARPLIERLWQKHLPPQYLPIWAALTPASLIYGAVLELRARWWQTMARAADVPVISIGNLTVGGNGKTPFTLFL